MLCLSSGCTQRVFLILAVSLLKRHRCTHTHCLGKIREQTCRKLVWGFILVVFLIVASYLFSVWPCVHRDGQNEWRERIKMKEMYKGWKKNIVPTMNRETTRTHTLIHTGLWIHLAFYSLVTQTERKTESVSGSTKTFCVINKAEKEIQAECTKQLHKVFQEQGFFFFLQVSWLR